MKNLFATAASVLVLGFAMPAMAQSSTSNILQYGGTNLADVDQIGIAANNTSTIKQGVNDHGSSGNKADVEQDGTAVQNNKSTIHQDGADNSAVVKQGGIGSTGDKNTSQITQDGSNNKARVGQGNVGFTGAFDSNKSDILQKGDFNTATVVQGGDPTNYLDPAQQVAHDFLGASAFGVNDGPNSSFVNQLGDGHTAIVIQGGGSASNESHIDQDDNYTAGGNIAKVFQSLDSINFSDIDQLGEGNTATVNQHSGFSVPNTSTVFQSGYNNTANVNQH